MSKDNVYDEEDREESVDNDEMGADEDGFVRGYEDDDYKADEE